MSKDRLKTYSLVIGLTRDERIAAGPDLPTIRVDEPESYNIEILKKTGLTLAQLAVQAGILTYPPFVRGGADTVTIWRNDKNSSFGVDLTEFGEYRGEIFYDMPKEISTWTEAHSLVAVTVLSELMKFHQPTTL